MNIVETTALPDLIGTHIGTSDWLDIDQDRINAFADVTEDHQFIHVNEEAAKATPFGGTVAHGFLTLSMLSKMAMGSTLILQGIRMGVNYGFDRVRFIEPVPSGKRVRGHFSLADAQEKKPGQWLLTYEATVEIEGLARPALQAQWLTMQFIG